MAPESPRHRRGTPAHADDSWKAAFTAGAPFEIYDRESVSPFPSARWTILLERLQAVIDEAMSLGEDIPRVAAIGDTVRFVRRNLAEVAG